MYQESCPYINQLLRVLRPGSGVQFVLFEVRKNRPSYSLRSSLIHSYGYASAGDRTDYLARFPLNFEPFMQYAG